MIDPYQKIKDLLDLKGAWYQEWEHEPVYTSLEASQARNEPMNSGAKALLFKAENQFFLAVVPGGEKVSFKKLKKVLGRKNIRMAYPEEVKEVMGCKIGACYPLGSVAELETVIDESLLDNNEVSFNPGVHHKTIKMKTRDLFALSAGKKVDILNI